MEIRHRLSIMLGLTLATLSGCGGAKGLLPAGQYAAPAPQSVETPLSRRMGARVTERPAMTVSPFGLAAHRTAYQLGLWPRQGRSVPLCPPSSQRGRCYAWVRTDVRGLGPHDTPSGYGPNDLQTAYDLMPYILNGGKGQTVALVDPYDNPNAEPDLAAYRAQWGLPSCTTANGCFQKKAFTTQTCTNCVKNSPGDYQAEESLDVDMVSAICPNCHILLVESAGWSDADLLAAENYATSHASYVSNSWGYGEGDKAIDAAFDVPGDLITASTGDGGYNKTASYPAILPTVVAVGGTTLSSIDPRVETVWSGAGSGCSTIYSKPSFQHSINTGCSKRAQGDVSAIGNPNTGVAVYDTFDNGPGWQVYGGTSVSSPLVASIYALNSCSSHCSPNPNNATYLYSHTGNLHKITSGSNGSCGAPLCTAAAGQAWNGPTGLGSPIGVAAFALPPVVISANRVALTTATSHAQTVNVTQAGYSGTFHESDTCAKVASVTASSNAGGQAEYAVSPIAAGTCHATFSGANDSIAALQIDIVPPIVFVNQDGPLLLTTGEQTQGIYMSQAGFNGPFSENDTCSNVATVQQPVSEETNYGLETWSDIKPIAVGTCTVTVSGEDGVTASLTIDVAAPIALSPVSMDFYSTGSTNKSTVTIKEASFSDALAFSSTCGPGGRSIVAFNLLTNAHGDATISLVPQIAGQCKLVVTGDYGQKATLPIYVGPASPVVASPAPYLALLGGPAGSNPQTIDVSQTNFAGTLTESDDCVTQQGNTPDYAILTAASNAAGRAQYKATPEHSGTCTATFAGGSGNAVALPIVVALNGTIGLYPSSVSIVHPSTTATFAAMQYQNTGSFQESDNCNGIATVQSGSAGSFSVAAEKKTGSCTVTISGNGQSAQLPISVTVSNPPAYAPVFVANTGDGTINEIPTSCASASCTITLPGSFSTPRGVAQDQQGNLFVGNYGNNTVSEIPANCSTPACITTIGGGFSNPWGVAVDPSDNVFVADSFNNAVKEIPNGCTTAACVTVLGGGFNSPYGVAVDANDNVYVADYGNSAIKEIPNGCTSANCVPTLGGGFSAPVAIGLDENGNVYVADYGNDAVKEMPNNCANTACVTVLGGGFNGPQGVAVDSKLNVYVGDYRNNAVKVIPAGCASSPCVVSLGGGFRYPSGVSVSTVAQQLRHPRAKRPIPRR